MSELLILRGLLFAAECFLASLLLPVFAFAASALLRRRAALRHLVWTTMFGVLAVLPLVALLLPPRRIVEHVAAPVVPITAPVIAAPPSLTLSLSDLFTPENILLLLLALWLAGFCWHVLRLGVGGLGLMRLRRRSLPFATEIATGCEVRLSSGEDGPSTFGIFRPIVLLPHSAQAWPAARLDAVLRHEAAHVARRDTLSQFIARLVCAVFWLNPLLWLAARSLRREAEIAADDAVLASGLTPSLYAAELVSLAAESRGITPGVAMAGPPLAQRVEAVLADNSSRKGVTKMDMARTVTLGLTAALLLGVARFDIAVAQDAPAPVAPAKPAAVIIGPVPADPARAARVRTRLEAMTAEVKAKADAVTAKAKAKAAAETDPVKKAQYEQDAIQAAADATKVKARADRVAADARANADQAARPRYADEARRHMALAFQLADEVRQKAQVLAQIVPDADQQARANADRMRLAEAAPRAESPNSADAESSTSVNGVTTTIRSGDRSGAPQNSNSNSNSNNGLTIVPPPPGGAQNGNLTIARPPVRPQTGYRYYTQNNDVSVDIQVNRAVEEAMNRPEVRDTIRDAVSSAMTEATRKITAAIAEARAKAGLPPVPAAPPAPRPFAAPIPPVPPAPPPG